MFIFVLTFQLIQQQQRETKSNLNKEQITFFNRGLIVLCKKGGTGKKRVALTKRFSGWLIIKLQVETF